MGDLEVFLAGTITGLSALLTLVALASFLRARTRRTLALAAAFAVLGMKGLLLLLGTVEQDTALSVLDLTVLALLYLGLLTG